MTDISSQIMIPLLVSVISSAIIGIAGIFATIYVGQRLFALRLDRAERDIEDNRNEMEKRLDTVSTAMGEVRADVAWIRGKLEGR